MCEVSTPPTHTASYAEAAGSLSLLAAERISLFYSCTGLPPPEDAHTNTDALWLPSARSPRARAACLL